jgi:hypothetical protein
MILANAVLIVIMAVHTLDWFDIIVPSHVRGGKDSCPEGVGRRDSIVVCTLSDKNSLYKRLTGKELFLYHTLPYLP